MKSEFFNKVEKRFVCLPFPYRHFLLLSPRNKVEYISFIRRTWRLLRSRSGRGGWWQTHTASFVMFEFETLSFAELCYPTQCSMGKDRAEEGEKKKAPPMGMNCSHFLFNFEDSSRERKPKKGCSESWKKYSSTYTPREMLLREYDMKENNFSLFRSFFCARRSCSITGKGKWQSFAIFQCLLPLRRPQSYHFRYIYSTEANWGK